MLPALAFFAHSFALGKMRFSTLAAHWTLAAVHVLLCASVIVAQVTRKAYIYWPFMVYSVKVATYDTINLPQTSLDTRHKYHLSSRNSTANCRRGQPLKH